MGGAAKGTKHNGRAWGGVEPGKDEGSLRAEAIHGRGGGRGMGRGRGR